MNLQRHGQRRGRRRLGGTLAEGGAVGCAPVFISVTASNEGVANSVVIWNVDLTWPLVPSRGVKTW